MKEKLMRFMQGRYGVDSFSKFLLIAGLLSVVISGFSGRNAMLNSLLTIVGWACVIYTYFRMFSKNYAKRYAENQAYLKRTSRIRYAFQNRKKIMAERKVNHIYRCPSCKQKIRIPKGKGRIEISCPKCHTTFVKRS